VTGDDFDVKDNSKVKLMLEKKRVVLENEAELPCLIWGYVVVIERFGDLWFRDTLSNHSFLVRKNYDFVFKTDRFPNHTFIITGKNL
jgi:hypothetical protein